MPRHPLPEEMPDFANLVDYAGGATMNVRLRQGENFAAYVAFRQWCWYNRINFSEVINALIGPLSYACENFSRQVDEHNITMTLNFGDVTLNQIYKRKGMRQPGEAVKSGAPSLEERKKTHKHKTIKKYRF